MTPPIFSMIDGIQREVTSIPVVIDGVQRELDSMTAIVDGVEREIFSSAKYVWEKYACTDGFVASGESTTLSHTISQSVYIFDGATPDSEKNKDVILNITAGNYFSIDGAIYLADTDVIPGFPYCSVTATPVTGGTVKGDYIDTVESKDPAAYPDNGEQDGYWYVKI